MAVLRTRLCAFTLLLELLGACSSTVAPGSGAGGQSPLVFLDPGDFACLASPIHETIILPSRRVRKVEGIVDYDGETVAGVHIFLEALPGSGNRAFHEVTSKDGLFSFKGIEDGKYRLRTCLSGWNELLIELEVDWQAEHETLSLSMTLA